MEIPTITEDVYSALHEIWASSEGRRPDGMRDPNVLDYFLFQDGGATRIHIVDGTPAVMLFGEIEEGLNATVLLLNPEEAGAGQLLHEMREVMREWGLKRLTAEVPGPVKDVQQKLKEVGFRREGHMRRATFWNGRLVGLDVWGIYKDGVLGRGRKPLPQKPSDVKQVEAIAVE